MRMRVLPLLLIPLVASLPCSQETRYHLLQCRRVLSTFLYLRSDDIQTTRCSEIYTEEPFASDYMADCLEYERVIPEQFGWIIRRVISNPLNINYYCGSIVQAMKQPVSKTCRDAMNSQEEFFKVTGKTCLFFHGVNERAQKTAVKPLHFGNWDHVHQLLEPQGLCDVYYVRANMHSVGWDNVTSQTELCATIDAVQADYIFTHSASNLVIAGGIIRGVPGCDRIEKVRNFRKKTNAPGVKWFGVGGPMRGSHLVDLLVPICAGNGLMNSMARKAIAYFDEEVCASGRPKPAMDSLRTDFVARYSRDGAYDEKRAGGELPLTIAFNCKEFSNCIEIEPIAFDYMAGSMCGTTYASQSGERSLLDVLGRIAKGVSDGMVPVEDCRLDRGTQRFHLKSRLHSIKYADRHVHAHYLVPANHIDISCVAGDVAGSRARPCMWVQDRVHVERMKEGWTLDVFMPKQ